MTTYTNTPLTDDQLTQARRILHRDGWEYQEDRFFPVSDPRRKGWWINSYSDDPDKSNRRGDSKDYHYATQLTYDLYSGHTRSELG